MLKHSLWPCFLWGVWALLSCVYTSPAQRADEGYYDFDAIDVVGTPRVVTMSDKLVTYVYDSITKGFSQPPLRFNEQGQIIEQGGWESEIIKDSLGRVEVVDSREIRGAGSVRSVMQYDAQNRIAEIVWKRPGEESVLSRASVIYDTVGIVQLSTVALRVRFGKRFDEDHVFIRGDSGSLWCYRSTLFNGSQQTLTITWLGRDTLPYLVRVLGVDGTIETIQTEFDERGNPVQRVTTRADELPDTVRFEYEYDERGNWTVMRFYNKYESFHAQQFRALGFRLRRVVHRTIQYYSDKPVRTTWRRSDDRLSRYLRRQGLDW